LKTPQEEARILKLQEAFQEAIEAPIRKIIEAHARCIASHPLPEPPDWGKKKAVMKFITQWADINEKCCDLHLNPILRSQIPAAEKQAAEKQAAEKQAAEKQDLLHNHLLKMLKSGQDIALLLHKEYLTNLLEQTKRKPGRPKKSIEKRRMASRLPDAELMYREVVKFLKHHYPGVMPRVKGATIHDRAIEWTAARFEIKNEATLSIYVSRPAGDRRRLWPRP
jgi:hypothetical protein